MNNNEDAKNKNGGGKIYDILLEKEWLFKILGYGRSTGFLYSIYKKMWVLFFLFSLYMAFYGIYLAILDDNLELIISGIHVLMTGLFFVWSSVTRWLTVKSLERARSMILSGFYTYEEEDADENIERILVEGIKSMRKNCNIVMYAMFGGIFSNVVVFPLSQYSNVPDDKYEQVVNISSPYLPHSIHSLVSTRTFEGFLLAYLQNFLFQFGINGITVVMTEIYIGSWGQLKLQLDVLNYSLRNIQRRAALLYYKRQPSASPESAQTLDLWDDPGYRECLMKCIRSNVLHHLALLRFKDSLTGYCGSCLLIAVLIASLTFATSLALIMIVQGHIDRILWLGVLIVVLIASLTFATSLALIMIGQPPNLMMHYTFVLIGEQFYAFYLCYMGEQILQGSSDLFESLYAMPWFNCTKSWNKVLRIFMANTKEPMKVKCLVLEVTASLDVYGTFLSTMYKIVNVLRTM